MRSRLSRRRLAGAWVGPGLTALAGTALADERVVKGPGPAAWQGDLAPIAADEWSYDRAAHLLERAGFGGTPEEIAKLAAMTPEQAVGFLVDYEMVANDRLPAFEASNIHDPGLVNFPPSRPATTQLAATTGEALGIKVKPSGNRRLQPVVDKFFYWLRASMLETRRVAYWWADRMLNTRRPLEEKMTLFWHGHFATSEEKVRDARKMRLQNETFRQLATGNFRDLVIAVAKDPAMLTYLDAGVNVKGAPNENFAREIMEMFTIGVGHYTETDHSGAAGDRRVHRGQALLGAASCCSGWTRKLRSSEFQPVNARAPSRMSFLGRTGNFDGVDAVDIYRYFVRGDPDPALQARLGAVLRDNHHELKPLLRTIFLSRDLYSRASVGTHIKSPIELVVSTYKKLGAGYHTPVDYGLAPLDLDKIAALIAADLPARVYYASFRHNAFDTHVHQNDLHQRLLTYTADAIAAFMADLERIGRADEVVLLAFSEFGRRVPENTSLGTDHGTAGPMFVVGKPVRGGHYGPVPSLTELTEGENLRHTTDFRRVYATVADGWLGYRNTGRLLGADFEPFPMFV